MLLEHSIVRCRSCRQGYVCWNQAKAGFEGLANAIAEPGVLALVPKVIEVRARQYLSRGLKLKHYPLTNLMTHSKLLKGRAAAHGW